MERVDICGCQAWAEGGSQDPVVLVTGPPTSARLFRHVQARIAPRPSLAVELVAPGLHGLDALSGRLDEVLEHTGASAVVAHGLAVPVALRSAAKRILVTNGPLGTPDPVLRAMARLGPRLLAGLLIRRNVLGRWMPSSLGLRRLVTNPYVMDRDIVVMLLEPVLQSAEHRECAAAWICDAARRTNADIPGSERISAIWGDNDPLAPLADVRRFVDASRIRAIPGGRHLHPEERPWELADRLEEWLDAPTTT